MMKLVLNLLGTTPTDDRGRVTLNRRGVLTCANGLYFLDDPRTVAETVLSCAEYSHQLR
jgi:hypothetical protein